MTFPDDDRPDPVEQPIRARVPEHVARGAFSTGVIVMTAQTEIILDFIQNLGRPHQIVARVVMPHSVLPQLVDALQRNMELYRNRWGELPHIPSLPPVQTSATPSSGSEHLTPQHSGQSAPVPGGQPSHIDQVVLTQLARGRAVRLAVLKAHLQGRPVQATHRTRVVLRLKRSMTISRSKTNCFQARTLTR